MRFWVTVRKLNVTDRRTDGRTDGRTDRRTGGVAISPVPGPTAPAGDKNGWTDGRGHCNISRPGPLARREIKIHAIWSLSKYTGTFFIVQLNSFTAGYLTQWIYIPLKMLWRTITMGHSCYPIDQLSTGGYGMIFMYLSQQCTIIHLIITQLSTDDASYGHVHVVAFSSVN